MPAVYTPISLPEMEKLITRAYRALAPRKNTERGETYFDLTLSPKVAVRVWTSIGSGSGGSAAVGEDAIRVQLMYPHLRRPLKAGKAPIVKRTQGWRDNLQKAVAAEMEDYYDQEDYWEKRV